MLSLLIIETKSLQFYENQLNATQCLFMVALCNRETIYIFMLWFVLLLLSFFFPRLISAVGDWMFTILWHMAWP